MSVEDNKRIVRRYQDIYNSNQLDALIEVLSEELLTPRILPGMPSGIKGAKAVHQVMLAGFPDYKTSIEDMVAEGDRVAVRIRMTGTHTGTFMGTPASGNKIDFTGMYIARLKDGKIVEHWGEEDAISLLRQIGAMP